MSTGSSAIRGMKVGSGPAGDMERGPTADSQRVTYHCANGHRTSAIFAIAEDVVVPETWTCPKCGFEGGQDEKNPPPPPTTDVFKTHLDYVKERRSAKDGEAILAEALSSVRERGLIV